MRWSLVGLVLFLCVNGCASPTIYRYRQIVMGVEATVSIASDEESHAIEGGRLAFARLAELEQVMSDYRPDSELMRLCATHDVAVPVSDDLFDVLERAEAARRMSDGLFDISVGPLTLLWREARKRGEFPTESALAEACSRSGGDAIQLDRAARTVTLRRAGMRLDLGGIGKGYAAAKAIEHLLSRGHPAALVAIAGDIAAGDAPPGKAGWAIDIERPGGTRERIDLVRSSVSTSGDREQFLERDGVRYSHLLDPRTGLGATTQRQVTLRGPDGALVDALSSALSIASDSETTRLTDRLDGSYRVWRFTPASPAAASPSLPPPGPQR